MGWGNKLLRPWKYDEDIDGETLGEVALTFERKSFSKLYGTNEFLGSNGERYLIKRCFKVQLYGGNRWTLLIPSKTNDDDNEAWEKICRIRLTSFLTSWTLEDLREEKPLGTVQVKQHSFWNESWTFSYDDKQYVWQPAWKGFKLEAADEEQLKKKDRTLYAYNFLKTHEVQVFEAGAHIPHELLLMTALLMEWRQYATKRARTKLSDIEDAADLAEFALGFVNV